VAGYTLALDGGTTAMKAFLYDPDGKLVGSAERELSMYYPASDRVEQDPTEIADKARTVLAAALANARVDASELGAIGITNQRSSIVAWDARTLRPVSPMIIWQDTRAAARCDELQAQGFFITPQMAASKAEWIVANCDEAKDAAAAGALRFGLPGSWLVAALAGDAHVCDYGNASVSGFYSYFENCWDTAALAAMNLEPEWLPRLVDSSGVFAETRPDILGRAVPIASMAGDQQSSLFGLGCAAPGETKCSYGTSAMVTASTGSEIAVGGAGTFPIVAWRIDGELTLSLEGQVYTAGAAVQWLRDGLGIIDAAEESGPLAESVASSGGVWAVPAFQGLGTPGMNGDARALVGGVSRSTTRAEIVRAVLEGVAHRVADAAEAVWEYGGRSATLRADGGASRNTFLMQTQADLLGVPVAVAATPDGAAFGAAKLAGLATGVWTDADGLGAMWNPGRVYEPRLDEAARVQARSLWAKRFELCLAAAV
jgi:glycerol kinase